MKYSKFIVLGAGAIGLLSFFMPLIAVQSSGVTATVSAYQIVIGIDSLQDVADEAAAAAQDAATQADVDEFNEAMGEVKGVVLAIYAPALLLTLFGVLGLLRKKFGRGSGVGSLVFGLIGLAIWALINSAAGEVQAEAGESVKGIGMHMLMLTGVGGTVGGLIALIKPDRGAAAGG